MQRGFRYTNHQVDDVDTDMSFTTLWRSDLATIRLINQSPRHKLRTGAQNRRTWRAHVATLGDFGHVQRNKAIRWNRVDD